MSRNGRKTTTWAQDTRNLNKPATSQQITNNIHLMERFKCQPVYRRLKAKSPTDPRLGKGNGFYRWPRNPCLFYSKTRMTGAHKNWCKEFLEDPELHNPHHDTLLVQVERLGSIEERLSAINAKKTEIDKELEALAVISGKAEEVDIYAMFD